MAYSQQHGMSAPVAARLGGRRPSVSALTRLLHGGLAALILWQERAAEREQLAHLSDFHLKDMGLTRADVDQEVMKPFWRP